MSPSQLKAAHLAAHPDSHFFDRDTMRHFGDTMANFGCRRETVADHRGVVTHHCWELYRKRPVRCGLQAPHYFDRQTLAIVHPAAHPAR